MKTEAIQEMHHYEMAGTIGGIMLSWVAMIIGFIHVDNIISAILVSFIGATVSFFTTKLWKKITSKK